MRLVFLLLLLLLITACKPINQPKYSMITIKAELSPGTSIESAFKEARDVAIKLNCFIDFKFNDVHCVASPQTKIEHVVIMYDRVVKSKSDYKFMCP